MPKFWACSANKEKFQSFVISHVLDLARKIKISIIFSGTVVENVSKPALHLNELGNVQQIDQLNFKYEEADLRIIPHIGWDITMFSRSRVTVVSEDTDVLVLLLHYFEKFHSLGLQNLFLQLGKGEKRRMLPVHIMFERLGKDFCQEILSAHLATGSDHLSKVGSKRCALTADPEKSLCNFGKTAILDEDQLKVAEEYLVNVLSSSNGVKTFDELRVQVHKKTGSALGLPPTSYSIRNGHIRRWWYLLKESSNLLTPEHERCLQNMNAASNILLYYFVSIKSLLSTTLSLMHLNTVGKIRRATFMPTSNFTSFLMNFATLADVKLDAKLNIVLVLKRRGQNVQTFAFALIAKTNEHTHEIMILFILSLIATMFYYIFYFDATYFKKLFQFSSVWHFRALNLSKKIT